MANPLSITLGARSPKKAAVFGTGTVADDTVLIEFDQDIPQLDIVNALQKCIQLVIEQEY